MGSPTSIDELLDRMAALLAPMEAGEDPRRHFLSVYTRMTTAVRDELREPRLGGFVDPDWTERWDVAFAGLYLDALERWDASGSAPGPWQVAFAAAAGPRVPPLRHLLLGMNAHINYDLAQALLEVIDDEGFDDPGLLARRAADHGHIDRILVGRVAVEDRLLQQVERPGDRTLLDRALTPFDRAGTRRFLREARAKVWRNARVLSSARRQGPETLASRIEELWRLSAARVEESRGVDPGLVLG